MKIYTIGFTGTTARDFFGKLRSVDALRLLDARLHNTSQLAGFAKKGSIDFFTEELTGLTYAEAPLLAPSEEMFKEYRKTGDWPTYEDRYIALLRSRRVETEIDEGLFEGGVVLLCSEPTAERCHRRLAAEYLRDNLFEEADIIHI